MFSDYNATQHNRGNENQSTNTRIEWAYQEIGAKLDLIRCRYSIYIFQIYNHTIAFSSLLSKLIYQKERSDHDLEFSLLFLCPMTFFLVGIPIRCTI